MLKAKKAAESTSSKKISLSGYSLTTNDVATAVKNDLKITIPKATEAKVDASAKLLEKLIEKGKIIYGVNTSMGGFVNWLIPENSAYEMQNNLIAAVATNVGTYLEDDVVKAGMIVRINSLARGCSAITFKNFSKLVDMYNAGVIPCVPSKGSLGASGDLGPLACIALVATGKWKAKYNGKIMSGAEALKKAKITPMKLTYKEGLSLINGTSMMAGFACLLVEKAIQLLEFYELLSCLTFEGLAVKKKPFDPTVHREKCHPGQLETAENIWNILKDSKLIIDEDHVGKTLKKSQKNIPTSEHSQIEDAYSIRCTPHILGPIRENLNSIKQTINREINSASDNPLVIPEAGDVFHNGHFHGQYIAMAMDQLSISLTTLSNLSDRRIDRFMDKSNSNGLPPFLCADKPGLRLGLMGGQFMATSLTAENRSLCTPLSIQTLTSTGDFQDIVSMGLIAARRAQEIFNNTVYILSFELLCAAQAVDIRGNKLLSTQTKKLYNAVREFVPFFAEKDVCLTDFLEQISNFIKSDNISNKLR